MLRSYRNTGTPRSFLLLFVYILIMICFLGSCKQPDDQPTVVTSPPPSGANASNTMPSGSLQATVERVRLVPYTTPDGRAMQMVLVDWKNSGTVPIRVVHADITAYSDSGSRLGSSANDYTIYAVSDTEPGIGMGQTYKEPNGEGFILVPVDGFATRAEATITRVDEKNGFF